MKIPRWQALVIIAIWVVQLHTLWPLPDDAIAQMATTLATGTQAVPPGVLEDLGASLWRGWLVWAVIVSIGIASGVMALRNHRHWAGLFLSTCAFYLTVLCPWRLSMEIHAASFNSLERFTEHWSWVAFRPSLIWGTVIFPAIIVFASLYVIATMVGSRQRHAI